MARFVIPSQAGIQGVAIFRPSLLFVSGSVLWMLTCSGHCSGHPNAIRADELDEDQGNDSNGRPRQEGG